MTAVQMQLNAEMEEIVRQGEQDIAKGIFQPIAIDFEAAYGEVGKGFIHVHHVVPISSIGKEYELDVEKDLVPVCPNCHYMLHRKDPPYTVEEMKKMRQTIK